MLTLPELAQALPPHLKRVASQSLLDQLNNVTADPIVAQQVRDNFVSYTSVLKEGKFKVEDYINAVAFVSYRLMGFNNQESYSRTFPQRYQALLARGVSDKDISSYVAAYSNGKLVNLILEQTLTPSWILNQDVYQKAINKQAELMMFAKSEKVQTDAANSLLTHLKRPEKKEIELNLGVSETSGMKELKDMLTDLAEKQRSLIEGGVQTKEIAHQELKPIGEVIEGEFTQMENPDE